MAALTEVILKTDSILAKYGKYDPDGEAETGKRPSRKARKSDDAFSDSYFDIMDRAHDLQLRAGEASSEKNRALRAALNAELRKEKALLAQELVALEQLVGSGKGVTHEMELERLERVEEARGAVEDIPDGMPGSTLLRPQREVLAMGEGPSGYGNGGAIVLDTTAVGPKLDYDGAYEHTDATAQFVRETTTAQDRQDLALDNIERGLSTLKDLGGAMGEELQRQDVLIDEVGAKMDAVTKELETNNMKLHKLVTKVRSTRRFFIDIILICVLLAIGLYLYQMLK